MLKPDTLETKAALIDRLLNSPLARQMERSGAAETARRHARDELVALTESYQTRIADLEPRLKAAQKKHDELRAAYESAQLEVTKLSDLLRNTSDAFYRRRAELEEVSSAREERLAAMGIL